MNTIKRKNKGFTLLEIIIVVIIVGVLASLALPRLFSTVEFSRSTEALSAMGSLRSSMERCLLASGNTYVGCTMATIDMANPATSPGSHFTSYTIAEQIATGYTITALRNTIDGGVGTDTIIVTQAAAGVTRSGTTAFAGIK